MGSITLHIAALECPMAYAIPLRKAKDVDEFQKLIRSRANRQADTPITMYDHNKSVILWEDWEDIVKPDGIYLADFGNNFRRYLAKEAGSDRSILADSNLGILAAAISDAMLGPLGSSPAPSNNPLNALPTPISNFANKIWVESDSSVSSRANTITDNPNKDCNPPGENTPISGSKVHIATQPKKNIGEDSTPLDNLGRQTSQVNEGTHAAQITKASPLANIVTTSATPTTATTSPHDASQQFNPPKQSVSNDLSSKPSQSVPSVKRNERPETDFAGAKSAGVDLTKQTDTKNASHSSVDVSKLHDIKVYVSKSTSPASTMELDVPPECTIEEIVATTISASDFVSNLIIQELVGGVGGALKNVDKFNQSSARFKSAIGDFGTKHPLWISLEILNKAPVMPHKNYK